MKSILLNVILLCKWFIVLGQLQLPDEKMKLQILSDAKSSSFEETSNVQFLPEGKAKLLEGKDTSGNLPNTSSSIQQPDKSEDMDKLFDEKIKFCASVEIECGKKTNEKHRKYKFVCGLRPEGNGFRTRSFASTCDLLKYNCKNNDTDAYLIVKLEYCYSTNTNDTESGDQGSSKSGSSHRCDKHDCTSPSNTTEVCAIRTDGQGFRVKRFLNSCEMLKHNCLYNVTYQTDADYICEGIERPKQVMKPNSVIGDRGVKMKIGKNSKPFFNETLVIVDGSMFNTNGNINDTADNFFAATHLFDVPVKELPKDTFKGETRRRLIKIAGPVVIFTPPVVIPDVVKDSYEYAPTLGSCYHKCPEKCPDTYVPVCGVPGIISREPNVVFLNHCYMDAAQCRMKYHVPSSTQETSFYTEGTFVFCMGDTMNALYRFLPVLRTLQHMGRIKKKGYYRYQIRNMRFYNELLLRNPKFHG